MFLLRRQLKRLLWLSLPSSLEAYSPSLRGVENKLYSIHERDIPQYFSNQGAQE